MTHTRLWTTATPGCELHGEDLGIRRRTTRANASSSTPTHRLSGRRPHPLCAAIDRRDLHERGLSTDSTLPTTTPYLSTVRSTVELHRVRPLWTVSYTHLTLPTIYSV